MAGQKNGDREVIVNLARPRQPRTNRGGFGGQRNYGGNRSDIVVIAIKSSIFLKRKNQLLGAGFFSS